MPEIGVLTDVALDPYTAHGHDGLIDDRGCVINDDTVAVLVEQALVQAAAGRRHRRAVGHDGRPRRRDPPGARGRRPLATSRSWPMPPNMPRPSTARSATRSDRPGLLKGDKRGYQMDPANGDEALREVALDIAEGADMVMVKPGLPYLDVLARVKDAFGVPTFAYQVSRRICDDRGRRGGRRRRPRRADPRDADRVQARRRDRRADLSRARRRAPDPWLMLDDLRTEIERLRAVASPLEPDAGARRELGGKALDHALAYLDQVETALGNRPWSEVFAQSLEPEFADQGRDPARVLDYVAECIDRPGFATTTPRFMAYIPGGGLFHSALGDLSPRPPTNIRDSRQPAPVRSGSRMPASHWLASVIGYPETAAGTLTSGGSIANLTAIVAARDARDPDGGGAVYTTRFAHYCIDKALHIAGRGRSPAGILRPTTGYRMSAAGA